VSAANGSSIPAAVFVGLLWPTRSSGTLQIMAFAPAAFLVYMSIGPIAYELVQWIGGRYAPDVARRLEIKSRRVHSPSLPRERWQRDPLKQHVCRKNRVLIFSLSLVAPFCGPHWLWRCCRALIRARTALLPRALSVNETGPTPHTVPSDRGSPIGVLSGDAAFGVRRRMGGRVQVRDRGLCDGGQIAVSVGLDGAAECPAVGRVAGAAGMDDRAAAGAGCAVGGPRRHVRLRP